MINNYCNLVSTVDFTNKFNQVYDQDSSTTNLRSIVLDLESCF